MLNKIRKSICVWIVLYPNIIWHWFRAWEASRDWRIVRKSVSKVSENDNLLERKKWQMITMLCGKIENVPNELVDLTKEICCGIWEVSVCSF